MTRPNTGVPSPPCPTSASKRYGSLIFLTTVSILQLAADRRLPVLTFQREATEQGGLMSYGAHPGWAPLAIADLIVRVLRGEKPADLPLGSPDKFEFVINNKTARTLGIIIPPLILHSADEVIE